MARILFLLLLGLVFSPGTAQSILEEEIDNYQVQFTKWFDKETEVYPVIYNNPTYPLTFKVKFGHQFLNSKNWQNGRVCINNQFYFDLPLLLDIESEQLIVKQPGFNSSYGIALPTSDIQQFTIGGLLFVTLDSKQGPHFYRVLHKGQNVNLVAHHKKIPYLESDGSHIREVVNYFLIFKGDLIELKNIYSLDPISSDSRTIAKRIRSKDSRLNLSKEDKLLKFIQLFDEQIK